MSKSEVVQVNLRLVATVVEAPNTQRITARQKIRAARNVARKGTFKRCAVANPKETKENLEVAHSLSHQVALPNQYVLETYG